MGVDAHKQLGLRGGLSVLSWGPTILSAFFFFNQITGSPFAMLHHLQ